MSQAQYSTRDPETWASLINWIYKAKKKIPTPFGAMDWLYAGGNREGFATAIVGVESSGKSLVAGACAIAAIIGGYKVGVLNLDMDRRGWLIRALATIGNFSASALWELEAQSDFIIEEKLRQAAHKIREFDGELLIDDSRPLYSSQAVEIIDDWGKRGVDLVVVDYVQLLRCKDGNVRGPEAFDRVVADLVTTGRRHDMAIDLICQLNREGKTDKAPHLHHVLGGSAIERHCDVGIVLDHTTAKIFEESMLIRARCEKNRHLGRLPEWDVTINQRTLQVSQGPRFVKTWRSTGASSD